MALKPNTDVETKRSIM